MTSDTIANPSHARGDANPALTAALAITAIAAATLAGAWFFQLVLDIRPCPLCLEQRYAYYLVVPLGALTALAAAQGCAARRAACRSRHSRARGARQCRARHLSRRRRMGFLEGADRLHRPDRKSRQRRQPAGAARHRQGGPLRRSAVALSRPVAGRLQRADLAADGRDRGMGHRQAATASDPGEEARQRRLEP